MEAKGYTRDGTVDLRGRPALAFRTGKWKACAFLVGYEAFERMAFYGIASNLGMILLTMAASLKFLRPTCENGVCSKATSSQIAFFYSALYIIAIGAGGTKPNISTFGADQFDDFNPQEKRLKVSFFNWWMFSSFLGALFATLGLVYIQENLGWGLGYGVPTVGLVLSLFLFYLGTPIYRHKVSATSPTSDLIRVPASAFRNRRLPVPSDPSELHELSRQCYVASGKRQVHHSAVFKFLDKAAIKESTMSPTAQPCTVTQVEGIKLILGMFLIWLVVLIPNTIWAQINTLFVKQGTTLDRSMGPHFQIPAASLSSFVTLSMLISVPIYDRYFVPFMQARTGNPRGITLLQRIGIGSAIQVLAIAIAYAVEVKRMHVISVHGSSHPKDIVPMSIFWLLPQYVLLGVADVFNAIGLLEFFYDQAPEEMQSLGTTFFTSGIGIGNFLNSLLVTVVDKITGKYGGKSWIGNDLNDSHLDYYYGFLLVISTLNLGAFIWASSRHTYKREIIAEGAEVEAKQGSVLPVETKALELPPLGLQV
ncbi:hypothetical protein CRG98_039020 [Punica granatum]|uniref:Protein NRT1/ PTR FAMILY 5.1 n=1 Tax=Punica granatum TaxID=22663 RepID=A0A2I0IAB0_PUNGR|nr:hypothetical protein CRG98_039020 [Punica granatum]